MMWRLCFFAAVAAVDNTVKIEKSIGCAFRRTLCFF